MKEKEKKTGDKEHSNEEGRESTLHNSENRRTDRLQKVPEDVDHMTRVVTNSTQVKPSIRFASRFKKGKFLARTKKAKKITSTDLQYSSTTT